MILSIQPRKSQKALKQRQARGRTTSVVNMSSNILRIFYWASTVLVAVAFFVSGIANLTHAEHVVRDLAHLGYPIHFMVVLGTWKVLGAIAILVPGAPRLKEWACAGMIFDLTGAAFARASSGDGAVMVAVPLVIAALVLVSWALRPASRR